jgi:hypothetical protein
MSAHGSGPTQPFPATQWSLVDRARQSDEGGRRAALAVLLRRYLPALRAHLTYAKRFPSDRVDDLLQSFVADKIIEQNLLADAQEHRGRFRSFLLVTLNHFIISQHRIDTAAKRAPASSMADINQATEVGGGEDPAEQFNVAWARELIAEALRRMQGECHQSQRMNMWTVFEGRVVAPAFESKPAVDYATLVEQLQLATPLEGCRLLTNAKRMFARTLRAVAAEYAGDDSNADQEIEQLRRILSSLSAQSRGHLRS